MMTPSSEIDALARVPCFAGLDRAILARLAAHCDLRRFSPGESVSRRGELQRQLLIVHSGGLEVSMTSRKGKRHVIRYLHPGELFGLVPAIDGSRVIHDADARGWTELLHIPGDMLNRVSLEYPELLMRFLLLMCERFRVLYQNYTFRQLLPLHERVVLLLMELMIVEPQVPTRERRHIAIHMTQSEMSDMLCLSRQSLSAELKKLEKIGLIEIERAGITVINPTELERYASSLL